MHLLWFLLIGALAGFLAGLILKGKGFGLLWNLIIGIAGAYVGGFFFNLLDITAFGPRHITELVSATVGAVVLLFVLSLLKLR